MKKYILLRASATLLFSLLLAGCHTAHEAVEDTTDLAAHSVHKTGHAVAHGVRKVEKHL